MSKAYNEKHLLLDVTNTSVEVVGGTPFLTLTVPLRPMEYEAANGRNTKHLCLLNRTVVPGMAREFEVPGIGTCAITALDIKPTEPQKPVAKRTDADLLNEALTEVKRLRDMLVNPSPGIPAVRPENVEEFRARVNTVTTDDDTIDDEAPVPTVTDDGIRHFPVSWRRKSTGEDVVIDLTLTTKQIGGLKHNGSPIVRLSQYIAEQSGQPFPASTWEKKASLLLPAVLA